MSNVSIGDKAVNYICELMNTVFPQYISYRNRTSGRFSVKGDLYTSIPVLKKFCIEVKNQKGFKFKDWVVQAKEQASSENKDWLLLISLMQSERSKEVIAVMDFHTLLRLLNDKKGK